MFRRGVRSPWIRSSRCATTEPAGGLSFSLLVQLDLPFSGTADASANRDAPREAPRGEQPRTHAERVEFVRVRKARRYILRVKPDGTLRVTIPRGGSRAEAIEFMGRHLSWVTRERARAQRERSPVQWTHGSRIMVAGVLHQIRIEARETGLVACYAGRSVAVESALDVRPEIEADLRVLAREQLVPRLYALAARHHLEVRRVTIRNQRSRWGSCSRSGAIALNFRLVQMPPDICDYVLVHELMHLKQQNHGRRFWALVEQACPAFREAERWLRRDGRSLF
jgi:predicted metal-dependent hydrolase